jgi:hypothetical protein
MPITSSPGWDPVTAEPTASTRSARSQPRTPTFGLRNPTMRRAKYGRPVIRCQTSGAATSRVHPDEHVVVPDHGRRDVHECQDIGPSRSGPG